MSLQDEAEAKEWAQRVADLKQEMSEKWGNTLVVFTGSLPPHTTHEEFQRIGEEVLASVKESQAAFCDQRTDTILRLRPSGVGEENPGLHLTPAEYHETGLLMRDHFDEHTTEEYFDMWMAREGVS